MPDSVVGVIALASFTSLPAGLRQTVVDKLIEPLNCVVAEPSQRMCLLHSGFGDMRYFCGDSRITAERFPAVGGCESTFHRENEARGCSPPKI
jgi:hypothetical protein